MSSTENVFQYQNHATHGLTGAFGLNAQRRAVLAQGNELDHACTAVSVKDKRLNWRRVRILFIQTAQLGLIGRSQQSALSHAVKVFALISELAKTEESMSLVVLVQLLVRSLVTRDGNVHYGLSGASGRAVPRPVAKETKLENANASTASQGSLDAKDEPTRERFVMLSKGRVRNGPHGASLLPALSLVEMASELECATAETEISAMMDVSASPKIPSSALRAANVHFGLYGAHSLPVQLHAERESEPGPESVYMAARAKSDARVPLLI